jgi:L-ascorbate metabolism protein UlaG (beta-lactamase superfamily)
MKQRRKQFLPALRAGRFYGCFHDVQEGYLLRTASMLMQSIMYRYFAQNSEVVDWAARETVVERSEQLVVTWIGHSTFLIQVGGINILTDPIFGNASFLYQRIIAPGVEVMQLPPIDLLIISHNHPDHMEASSLCRLHELNKSMIVLVPYGDKEWFDQRGFEHVYEQCWWDCQTLKVPVSARDIRCTFLPAAHWSQRGLLDRNQSLWGSWMIAINGFHIYFAGDTAYGSHFVEIAQEFPHIDLGIMPIGPCEPREWMKHAHMDALEAGRAFLEIGAHRFVPMHWGTFHFGHEPADLPALRLRQWWEDNTASTHDKKLYIPKVGQRVLIS